MVELNNYQSYNWFDTLPKRCKELFMDAVSLSDKKQMVHGKWDKVLSAIHAPPSCVIAQKELAQFCTPSDVALYTAFNLLENYRDEIIFDPCAGHGSLLIASALVLLEKKLLSGEEIVKKLHGVEIDKETRINLIKNITSCLVYLCPSLSFKEVELQLSKQILLHDFNVYPSTKLHGCRVIANPPYKEDNKNNKWIPIVNKIIDADVSAIGFVLPVAIASSKRSSLLRDKIFKKFRRVSAFHHEIRPRPLFHGIDQRISIILGQRQSCVLDEYRTTGFLRHRAGERMQIWQSFMAKLNKEECKGVFPKVAPENFPFFKELESCKNRIKLSSIPTKDKVKEIWVHTTGRYHLMAQYTKPPEVTSKWKRLFIPETIANQFILAFKNGDLLKWWQIFGDGRDISMKALCNGYGIPL